MDPALKERLADLKKELVSKSKHSQFCFPCAQMYLLLPQLYNARPAGLINLINTYSRIPCYCMEPGTRRLNYGREMSLTDLIDHKYKRSR